ncbi:cytochrome c3 family protein [Geotalea toluenoxydans]|uniref:cytochrome c3 family protein n=1 Tax=Geotalea toluenoxydans TaxID=421624 RepID=UPI0006D0CBC7|nr:cytochrome c3 family protein [Geotalea toluenoxydans]
MPWQTERIRKRTGLASAALAAVVMLLLAAIMLVLFHVVYPAGLGPRQPIPFSHRVHVHVKKISCLMCHTTVTEGRHAGIPPLQTCMLCHQRIIKTYPYILELRQAFAKGKPVIWQRVNWVSEFVYFDHSMHLRQGIDCSYCHGNVTMMDRVVATRKFEMGFCIECHRQKNATHDCFTCHR